MAVLPNDAGSMRLAVALVDREAPLPGGQPTFAGVPSGRFLCTAAVEHFDRRDREWWPFVRLPALYVPAEGFEALVAGVRELLAGGAPGFAWQPGPGVPLALQLAESEGAFRVEVAVDLGPWLAEMVPGPPGSEACLFRFAATRAGLVRFADAVAAEAREVPPR